MYLKYCLIREVEYPTRGHATDAGIDFYMPKMDEEFVKYFFSIGKNKENELKIETITPKGKSFLFIPPSKGALIPSGVKVEIPFGHMGLFLNKSGVASKRSLLIGAQVIDTFYSGEVHIDLHNVGSEVVNLIEGDKLAQMVIVPALNCDLTLVEEEMLYDWMKGSEYRNEGGFGSTDKKNS